MCLKYNIYAISDCKVTNELNPGQSSALRTLMAHESCNVGVTLRVVNGPEPEKKGWRSFRQETAADI